MSALIDQPWFWPAIVVIVGLPIALMVLHELHSTLARRNSAYAKPVGLLRNWILPAGALYLLFRQLEAADADPTWSKVAASLFGFLVMLLLLSGVNAALFGEARGGSWRQRLPGIFVDLGRLVLIVLGIGVLLSWVWGANIGGLVTAVGVTSIVIGLAVQSAVGPVISGLLLLFEQPFRIGDWLDTEFGKGRVAEVNWRAVHIDTDNGLRVIPNAALADGAFVNLSRTTAPYFKAMATLSFAADDPPGEVRETLLGVAKALPARLAGIAPSVTALGAGGYRVSVPIASPADEFATAATLQHRAWYAAQRAGLHLDNVKSGHRVKRDFMAEHLGPAVASLGVDENELATMLSGAGLLPYAGGELIQAVDTIPTSVGFIIDGTAEMFVTADDGRRISLGELGAGDHFGGTALTRQRMIIGMVAITDMVVIGVSREAMNIVAQQDNRLARQIGDVIEMRRRSARDALAEAAQGVR
ncbi:MscS Small-conductance mechanosensitive channel [Mycobacteriaceae bacterium]